MDDRDLNKRVLPTACPCLPPCGHAPVLQVRLLPKSVLRDYFALVLEIDEAFIGWLQRKNLT